MSFNNQPGDTESTGTEAAGRVADVLLAFASSDAIGVSAVARQLSLSKAVVHRILQSLVSRGLLKFDPNTREYHLGPSATILGTRALRQLDLRQIAREDLAELRNVTRETTTLSLLVFDKRSYVDQCESPQEIKMTVELGRLYPLHAGASSRAILAFMPATDIEKVLSGTLDPLTEMTAREPGELQDRLKRVRDDGFATSRGERQSGAGSVAVPVFDAEDRVVGSISVCGPLARFDAGAIAKYVPLVVAAATNISRGLGWNSSTHRH